jgi:hypothetical protein
MTSVADFKEYQPQSGKRLKASIHTGTSVWIGLAAFVGWALSRIPSRKRGTYVPGSIQKAADLHPGEIKSSAKFKQQKEQGGLLSLVLELLGAVAISLGQRYFKSWRSEFRLFPKRGVVTLGVSRAQEVMLEVPRKLIEDWKMENPERELTDQAIAADIALVAVRDAISSFPDLPAYEVDVPIWLEEGHPIMNARACDHHDNGIRVWVIKRETISRAIKA